MVGYPKKKLCNLDMDLNTTPKKLAGKLLKIISYMYEIMSIKVGMCYDINVMFYVLQTNDIFKDLSTYRSKIMFIKIRGLRL